VLATALVDGDPQGPGGDVAELGERFATASGPASILLGRIVAADPAGTSVELSGLERLAGLDRLAGPSSIRRSGPRAVRLATAGRHNAANALGVAGAALALDVAPAAIAAGLAGFAGVGRRLERKGEAGGVVVYDDYAHHPTAIRETIRAVRQREPERPVWAAYEPLTYHRTAALLDAFAIVLAEADGVAIADIWAGRDPDTSIASARGLAEAVSRIRPGLPVAAPGSVEATAAWLAGEVHPGDVVLVMGGGRSYRIAEALLEALGR
jgi:UDP-N-acetylmuramate--alanine ligase